MLKLIPLLLTGLLLWNAPVWAALAIDNTSSASTGATNATTDLTWSHTVNGTNTGLVVFNSINSSGTAYSAMTCTATYAGVSMTKISGASHAVATYLATEIYTLINPTTGTNNVVIHCTGDISRRVGGAISFTDANQTTLTGTVATLTSGSDTVPSIAVTSTPSDIVVAVVSGVGTAGWTSSAAGSGETERWDRLTTSAGLNVLGAGYTEPGAATVTMAPTLTGSSHYRSMAGVSVKPAAGGGGGGSSGSPATTRYVDPSAGACSTYNKTARTCGSGSDGNSYATIAAGTAALAGGEILVIRTGTYVDHLRDRIPAGTAGASTIVQAYCATTCIKTSDYEVVTIRPPANSGAELGRVVHINGLKYITLRGLLLDGVNATTQSDDVIKLESGSDNFTIEDSHVMNGGSNGILMSANNVVIRRTRLHHNGHAYLGFAAQPHGLYASGGNGLLIEQSEFDHNTCLGFQIYPSSTNATIRYSEIHDNSFANGAKSCSNDAGTPINSSGAVLAKSGHLFEHNLVHGNHGAGVQVQFSGPANTIVRHNTIYNNGTYGLYIAAGATGIVVQNNHVIGHGTEISNNAGAGATLTTNRTTGAIGDCAVDAANNDFSQTVGSSCVNAGTDIGRPFNTYSGKTKPDQGAFESFQCNALASVNVNVLLTTCAMNLHTPILPALNITGMVALVGGVPRTTIDAVRQSGADSVVQTTFNGAACVNGETWTTTYTPGNLSDSTLIGNSWNQKAFASTSLSVTNDCTGAPPAGTRSQVAYRFYRADLVSGAVVPLAALNTGVTVLPNVPFAITTQTDVTVAASTFAERLRYSRNGGAYTAIPTVCDADNFCFYGTTGDPTIVHGTVTCCLSGALTPVDGTTQLTSDAVPIVTLAQDSSVVQRRVLRLGPNATPGDTYDLREYNQDGTAFTYTVTARVTVDTPPVPTVPQAVHLVGAGSNTSITMVWSPVTTLPNFAGYHIYQSNTSGVYSPLPTHTNTPASSAATFTPITQWTTSLSTPGTYFWIVRAFDTGGNESVSSNEITAVVTGFIPRTTR